MSLRAKRVSLAAACALLGATLIAGCTPISYSQGYQVLDERPGDAKVGETMAAVRAKYGSPTVISTFEPNIWFYMHQVNDHFGFYRPRIRTREIVAINFDKRTEQVASVNQYTEKDGRVIGISTRETPTRGRELGILEQILGTVGAPQLPPQDDDPGNRGPPPR